MTREPSEGPDPGRLRAMTEEEVREFAAFLRNGAERYWRLHADAEKDGHSHAEFFKFEAKTYEDVERGLQRLLAGRDPLTGELSRSVM